MSLAKGLLSAETQESLICIGTKGDTYHFIGLALVDLFTGAIVASDSLDKCAHAIHDGGGGEVSMIFKDDVADDMCAFGFSV